MYKVINLLFKVSDVANNSESDKALSYCKSALFKYNDDGTVAVFAIVDEMLDVYGIISMLPAMDETIKPEYKQYIDICELECDYLNGKKERPKLIEDVSNGLA